MELTLIHAMAGLFFLALAVSIHRQDAKDQAIRVRPRRIRLDL